LKPRFEILVLVSAAILAVFRLGRISNVKYRVILAILVLVIWLVFQTSVV